MNKTTTHCIRLYRGKYHICKSIIYYSVLNLAFVIACPYFRPQNHKLLLSVVSVRQIVLLNINNQHVPFNSYS